FGEQARSRHRQYLIRRIAWRIQANAEGGLSERALLRAEELANDADVRVTPPRPRLPTRKGEATSFQAAQARRAPSDRDLPASHDPRLPRPGTAIVRDYKDRRIVVNVLPEGFEWDGVRYSSLSAVAKAITGSHLNGFRFFGLEKSE
ncbi:MAG: DUF2924 domain-containing protein, partial [Phycisphaeraceae bacterium]|nr:DUF2924 domain-containing protein [Phycisphaeraceae bacterium]